jgi:hypothetical protein
LRTPVGVRLRVLAGLVIFLLLVMALSVRFAKQANLRVQATTLHVTIYNLVLKAGTATIRSLKPVLWSKNRVVQAITVLTAPVHASMLWLESTLSMQRVPVWLLALWLLLIVLFILSRGLVQLRVHHVVQDMQLNLLKQKDPLLKLLANATRDMVDKQAPVTQNARHVLLGHGKMK